MLVRVAVLAPIVVVVVVRVDRLQPRNMTYLLPVCVSWLKTSLSGLFYWTMFFTFIVPS